MGDKYKWVETIPIDDKFVAAVEAHMDAAIEDWDREDPKELCAAVIAVWRTKSGT